MHAVRACRHLLFEYGIVSILAFLFFSTSCSTTVAENLAQRPGDTLLTATLDHGGDERTYHIHLPPGFDRGKPAPLVIALHGGGGEGRKFDQAATGGTLTRAADKRGVVLVFPEAVDRHWFDGRPEVDKSAKRIDDTGFISAVIDAMAADYGIDPLRVYATGISNGGFMSVRLAIDLAEKIAAVAPVTAQMSKALEGKAPAQPISIMIVNGTQDPLVPFDGGHIRLFKFGRSRGEILSTSASIERFRRYNGCKNAAQRIRLPDTDPQDGTVVEMQKYLGCLDKTSVILVKVIGGGHTWPGGRQYLKPRLIGRVCRDIDASEMILDFFLDHPRVN